ncbi:hypothetical protein D9619_013467 [Psilocybe cf. subviscida]|uniref:Uncharacterized protein n=1 Tax=Psilocybe cf. subviscida TaxID=2480587 RepID=A0A8H5F924_9AGAR|nr:hypothetical protein D9619_013467 [Psilocybe cf. subviscida]
MLSAKGASAMPASGAVLGIDAQIFGEVLAPTVSSSSAKGSDKDSQDNETKDSEDEDDEDEELLTALAATSISNSAWKSAAASFYSPLCISMTMECARPGPKPRMPKDALVDAPLNHDSGKKGNGGKGGEQGLESRAKEACKNSMDVEHVFEQFMKRVGYEGEQCVRCAFLSFPLHFIPLINA